MIERDTSTLPSSGMFTPCFPRVDTLKGVRTVIELPESYVLARQLREVVKGKRVKSAEAGHTPHGFAWYSGKPAEYRDKLAGKVLTGADVRSGHVRLILEDMVMFISTPIKYHAEGEKRPPKHQLLIEFDDGSAISCTVQMWGTMLCFPSRDEGNGIPKGYVMKPDPSPLEPAFDRPMFQRLAAEAAPKAMSAKAFLATEQRIQGLGNGVLQDILWTARIHPKRKLTTLSEADWRRLYDALKAVPAEMIERGGRDTERDLFGRPGGYRTVLSKRTVGRPCPRCGTTIKKEAYLGGAIYYCPQCQPLTEG